MNVNEFKEVMPAHKIRSTNKKQHQKYNKLHLLPRYGVQYRMFTLFLNVTKFNPPFY